MPAIRAQRFFRQLVGSVREKGLCLLGECHVAASRRKSPAAFLDHIGQLDLGQFLGGELRTAEAETSCR
jgi:hypothetical protein